MYINFKHDNKCFNLRVASVINKNAKILLTKIDNFYTLPGGRVYFGETTENALKRSIYEELNIKIKIKKLLSINENFFDYDNDNYHELLFVYLCELENSDNYNSMVYQNDEKKSYHFTPIRDMINLNFKPEFLLSDLNKVSKEITHNVNNKGL